VDDQPLVRAGLTRILRQGRGFEVVGEAADGSEALRAAREHRPDMVLMDMRMKGMDGQRPPGSCGRNPTRPLFWS
jgi:DNA-binding NarL/FixJ family response regulator